MIQKRRNQDSSAPPHLEIERAPPHQSSKAQLLERSSKKSKSEAWWMIDFD